MGDDRRRMTFIVVPHGAQEMNTRSFEISYRRLRTVTLLLGILVVAWLAMAGSWLYMAGQAARVPSLQGEVARLEQELGQVEQLAVALRRLEGQYAQVRELLRADRAEDADDDLWRAGDAELLAASAGEQAAPSAWPLTERGAVARERLALIPGEHAGIDIVVAEGSYVRAAGIGVVSAAGRDEVYGNYVRIRHPNGYETLYGHASELFVAPNDRVERHQVIALSGSTGSSTEPHLHFEIWRDGTSVDPHQVVEAP